MIVGLIGMFFTRNLYSDREVSYVPRSEVLSCECCGFREGKEASSPKEK